MNSSRHEERANGHTTGTRMRGDVRFAGKNENLRHPDGSRRLTGGYASHSYEMENGRKVHCNRYNNGLIVQVKNDQYHSPNAPSTSRRGQGVNRPQGPLKQNFKSVNNGNPTDAPSQSRIRLEKSGRQSSVSFREGLARITEPPMLPMEWKPDASGILMDHRFQAKTGQRGSVGRRSVLSVSKTSGNWDRSSTSRRGGGSGGGRIRRRGGAGDDAMAGFRVSGGENIQTGEKLRGAVRRGGKTRGSRLVHRGGTWRGTTDSCLQSKDEAGVGGRGNSENLDDSNSTDDDQYRLTVDLKVDDTQHSDVKPGYEKDREEHLDGGLIITMESHRETSDSSSREHSEVEEEVEESGEESEASDDESVNATDRDTSEVSNAGLEAVEVYEQQGASVQSSNARDEGSHHENEGLQVAKEMQPTDPPIEVTETDLKRKLSNENIEESKSSEDKAQSAEKSLAMLETCSELKGKAHCEISSGSITSEASDKNRQLNQDSGDCETSFESVPADENHNSSNSVIDGESALMGNSVTPENSEILVRNVEKVSKETTSEVSVNRNTGIKAEDSSTE